jgi:hypothetical protein
MKKDFKMLYSIGWRKWVESRDSRIRVGRHNFSCSRDDNLQMWYTMMLLLICPFKRSILVINVVLSFCWSGTSFCSNLDVSSRSV